MAVQASPSNIIIFAGSEPATDMASALGALAEEVARLRRKVAELEREKQAEAELPSPVFPPEVFRIIGSFMQPASRSLLNLALSNKDMWDVLQPRLFGRLELKMKPDFKAEKCKLLLRKHVKSLDVSFDVAVEYPRPPKDVVEKKKTAWLWETHKAIKTCFNLQTLCLRRFDFSSTLLTSYLRKEYFPNLRSLELNEWMAELPAWLPTTVLPNLVSICVTRPLADEETDIVVYQDDEFWDAVDSKLEKLKTVKFCGSPETLRHFSPALLGKVVCSDFHPTGDLVELVQLCSRPEFAPEEIGVFEYEYNY